MNSLKTNSRKIGSLTTGHLDVRLRKIRSLKTSSLQSKASKTILATARTPTTKPFVKSIAYGLVIASLALSGGAMATEAHAKTAKHVTHTHAIAHVARRQAAPAQQPDLFVQFFQGLFGGGGIAAKGARGAPDESTWVESPSYDNTSSAATDAQAASDAEVQAIQQMNDTNALNASMQAAEEQNDAANAATLQTEINANNGN
ncbi:MAG TPA: hypothetical protein VK825_19265 [Xanthobacteraceae bacterium]|jgi:hypothetical protein|nr:hypothetical protein [Xanthobacteraceae bacterium]